MKFQAAALLPLVMKLGDYLKVGFEHYVSLKASGTTMSPDMLAAFICMQMSSWNPDFQTRMAAARFLAGVAVNLAK